MKYFLPILLIISIGCGKTVYECDIWTDELRDSVNEQMSSVCLRLHTIDDVAELMKEFKYIPEPYEFEPTISMVFARNLCGDCQTSAVLGKWALKQIGISSRIITLDDGDRYHRMCLSNDNQIVISNNMVGFIPIGADWRKAVLTFDGKHGRIKDELWMGKE